MASAIEFMNLNTWDGLCPVLLPLGQKSMPSVGAASIGVLIPLTIFVVALFDFFYRICDCNAKGSLLLQSEKQQQQQSSPPWASGDGDPLAFISGDRVVTLSHDFSRGQGGFRF